jgi:DNA repair protein RecN (Recombination protein N)
MLLELSIKDFAIIEELRLSFEPGFNVLTGETGAGKSIIIDALGAVLGERVSADVVRGGAAHARIEATFDLNAVSDRADVGAIFAEVGAELDDGIVVLSREITSGGRSSARINGRAATAGMLNRIGSVAVDVHGQSEHLSLLQASEQLNILDRYAETGAQRAEVGRLVSELRRIEKALRQLSEGERERRERIELLRFQTREIEMAELRSGEEAELLPERIVLANAERLVTDAAAAYLLLAGDADTGAIEIPSASSLLQRASRALDSVASIDIAMNPLSSRLRELGLLVDDLASDLRDYRDRIEANPARLAEIDDRLFLLKQLQRKYGNTTDDVIEFGARGARELEQLTAPAASVEALSNQCEELSREIGDLVSRLSLHRREASEQLSLRVVARMGELSMGGAAFAVSIEQVDQQGGVPFSDAAGVEKFVVVDASGADQVRFLMAPYAGEALKPLARVASGGETARLMLALKSILSRADATPTLIFDEVDVGVGGRSGQVVGEKLWRLTEGHQVIVISHLAQIAGFADAHFRIAKSERGGRMISRVDRIDDAERIDELAAMLHGLPLTEIARESARELLARTRERMRHDSPGGFGTVKR